MIYNMDSIAGAKQFLPDESVDVIVTDPPYNLGFSGTTQTKTRKPRFRTIRNDDLSLQEYQRFTFQWLRQAHRVLKTGRHIYVFIDWRMYPYMAIWMRKVGFTIKNCLVWDKVNMGVGWQYRYQHEFIIFAAKGKEKARRIRSRKSTDIVRVPRISGNKTIHPTEKPVELMEAFIQNSTEKGELVADFFLGSGPVFEAAQKLGRACVGFEIDEEHFHTASLRGNKENMALEKQEEF